jgi:hypothetical protein
MNEEMATYARQMWANARKQGLVPEDMLPGDWILSSHAGTRVAFYINVPPSDAKRGGGVQAVMATRRNAVEQALARANWFRTQPLEIVATYADTEYLNSRLTMRPEGRRMLADAKAGRFDLILLATAEQIGTTERALDEFIAQKAPVPHLSVDILEDINAAAAE